MDNKDLTKACAAALDKAQIGLMSARESVFFSVVMLGLLHMWDDAQATAYTNGRRIGYNRNFFLDECSPAERIGLVLHEVLHCALMHMARGKGFDMAIFNMACDYVINLIIIKAGFKLPKNALYDEAYDDMSEEDVYYELVKQGVKPPPDFMQDIQCDLAEELGDEFVAEMDELLIQATMQSKAMGDKPGSIPGQIALHVEELLNPIVPWHKYVGAYMTQLIKSGSNWRKRNRRYADMIMPARQTRGLAHIACGADISGSVSEEGFQHFVSEGGALVRNFRPKKLTFITFDTEIRDNITVKKLTDIQSVEFHGRGGTYIDPLMQWAVDNNPACLIVFTDGYYTPPTIKPKCPVIWVVYDNERFKPPFGKHITYNF